MTLSPAVALTQALLRRPSITPADEGALGVIETALKSPGFETHRVTFREPGTPDIDNLFAKIGSGSPHLVFAGHSDVVPPGDLARWRCDPFSGEIAEGRIFGRGASDMKGAIAAFIAAATAYLRDYGAPKGAISLLITGDEEGPSINGTTKLLDWVKARGEDFDHCIVGEPTCVERLGDMMKIGRRGSLNATLTVFGKQGHVAYPERARNPAPVIARIVSALSQHELDRGTEHFSATHLEFSSIDIGNPAVNVIPAQARAKFNIRFNDLWTPERLAEEVRKVAHEAAQGEHIELDFAPCNARAFLTKPGAFSALVARAVEEVTGLSPKLSTSGGTSDARFITRDCEVLEFGLTNETIHAVNENAALADIERLTQIYARVLNTYFEAP
ncbi:MAG TPA: succinyl-diaminopimelate desuccinylase [Methylocystis sp.]|nr:succinyl-diaminopimelate desuccinylase [Methylocystis sp.]